MKHPFSRRIRFRTYDFLLMGAGLAGMCFDAGGGGGSGAIPPVVPPVVPPAPPTTPGDFEQGYHRLLQQVSTLQGQVPAAGSVVLVGDTATDYAAYQKMGKPADIEKALADGQTAAGDRDTLRRDGTLRTIADDAQLAYPVFQNLDRQMPGAEYEKRPVPVTDAKTKVTANVEMWCVRTPKADKTFSEWAPLTAHLRTSFPDFAPALFKGAAGTTTSTNDKTTPIVGFTPYVAHGGAVGDSNGGGGEESAVDKRIAAHQASQAKKTNPLMRAGQGASTKTRG